MLAALERFEGAIHSATRAVLGSLFACHGLQKLFGLFGGPPVEMNLLLWIAGAIELVGGAAIAFGCATRVAAFVCSGQMAFAYFVVHQPRGLLPIANQGELAAVYAWVFLWLAARGGGPWSIDARRRTA
jgi:putative oxidoreductase